MGGEGATVAIMCCSCSNQLLFIYSKRSDHVLIWKGFITSMCTSFIFIYFLTKLCLYFVLSLPLSPPRLCVHLFLLLDPISPPPPSPFLLSVSFSRTPALWLLSSLLITLSFLLILSKFSQSLSFSVFCQSLFLHSTTPSHTIPIWKKYP